MTTRRIFPLAGLGEPIIHTGFPETGNGMNFLIPGHKYNLLSCSSVDGGGESDAVLPYINIERLLVRFSGDGDQRSSQRIAYVGDMALAYLRRSPTDEGVMLLTTLLDLASVGDGADEVITMSIAVDCHCVLETGEFYMETPVPCYLYKHDSDDPYLPRTKVTLEGYTLRAFRSDRHLSESQA